MGSLAYERERRFPRKGIPDCNLVKGAIILKNAHAATSLLRHQDLLEREARHKRMYWANHDLFLSLASNQLFLNGMGMALLLETF